MIKLTKFSKKETKNEKKNGGKKQKKERAWFKNNFPLECLVKKERK